jgi:peptide/nickel transport system substrate-binding protein
MKGTVFRAALLALVVAVIAICAGTAQARPDATSRTLVVDTSFGLQTLDPTFAQTLVKLVSHARWDTLLTYEGSSLEPKPLLATSYTGSKDNKTFTFVLRRNARFADGRPMTAADVVFSLRRAIALKGDGASLLVGISVKAPSKYKVVLTSDTPNGAIPAIVTSPTLSIVNSVAVREHGGSLETGKDTAGPWFTSPASQGAGSGPYTMVQYDVNSQIILGRNLKYWGKRPRYDKIVIRNVPTQTQALNVQRGAEEVALDLGSQDVASLRGNSNVKVNSATSPQTFLFFSNNDPAINPMSPNKRLQSAIRNAIDYPSIIALAGQGAKQPGGVIPAFFPGSLDPKDNPKRNLAAARRELAASGLSNPKITVEFPTDRAINGLSFTSVAQKVQANLQEAGIQVELAGAPVTTILSRYLSGKIAWGIVPNGTTVLDANEILRFLPGNFLGNLAGWKTDAAIMAAADKARLASGSARIAAWQEVLRQQNARGPWIPLVNPAQYVVYTKDVAGIVYHPAWSIDFRTVKPAT